MFGIGPMELIIIAVVAIVFVGPQRLPEVMNKLGRLFVQFRRQTQDVRESINGVIKDAERELELERVRKLRDEIEQIKAQKLLSDENKENKHEYHESHYIDGEFVPPASSSGENLSDFEPFQRSDVLHNSADEAQTAHSAKIAADQKSQDDANEDIGNNRDHINGNKTIKDA